MMLRDLPIIDVVSQLPQRPGAPLRAVGGLTSGTLHYNGPATTCAASWPSAWEIAHLKGIAQYHVSKDWSSNGSGDYGHGIMYDFAVFPSGRLYKLRPLNHELWHCANRSGNLTSIAVHMPIGGAQDATPAAWQAFDRLAQALMGEFHFGRDRVFGHTEWPKYTVRGGRLVQIPNSPCPGPLLMRRLKAWRVQGELRRWRVIVPDSVVREGPGRQFPIALGGRGRYAVGHQFDSDTVTIGEVIAGSSEWLHRVDGIGFMHRSLVEEVVA